MRNDTSSRDSEEGVTLCMALLRSHPAICGKLFAYAQETKHTGHAENGDYK